MEREETVAKDPGQQGIDSLCLKEKLKGEKQKEMVDSPVNTPGAIDILEYGCGLLAKGVGTPGLCSEGFVHLFDVGGIPQDYWSL